MTVAWDGVSHVTKVDPAKPFPDDEELLAHTDLVMVGGSDRVNTENTLETLERVRAITDDIPVLQEPYRSEHVSRETLGLVDAIAVPAVYNGNRDNFVGKHLAFFSELAAAPSEVRGANLPIVGPLVESRGEAVVAAFTDRIIGEGYVIQNPDSRAAEVAGAETPFSTEQVAGAALATEVFYRLPVMYIEYSGRYGGPEDVATAAAQLEETVLLYGGGITDREQSEEILAAGADAVVVGDCFHDDPDRFLRTIPDR